VLLSIQGGSDLGLFEINEAAQLVANSAATDANIIFGAVIDDALGDEVRVTVIAAGFDEPQPGRPRPRTTAYSAAPYSAAPSSAAPSALPSAGAVAGQARPSSAGPAEWRPFQLGDARPAAPAGPSEPAQAAAADAASPAVPVNGAPSPASASSPSADAVGDVATAEHIPPPRHGSPGEALESVARDTAVPRPNRPDTTRRKSVVFEEDDELDVPDFLK
jgi:cell division protein FtsZ